MNTTSSNRPATARIAESIRHQSLPAAGLVIARHGPLGEDVQALGPDGHGGTVRSDTRFLFGSFTKVLTAAMVCQLVDEGRLALDDDIAQHVPYPTLAGITVRQLLCHSSGLPDMFEQGDDAHALISRLASLERLAAPGEVFSYTNAGYVLLGRLIEELTGQGWDENLKSRLLEPLGIVSTSSVADGRLAGGYVLDPGTGQLVPGPLVPDLGSAMDAAGGRLHGRADDAARLGRAIASGRIARDIGRDVRLLSEDMVAQMLSPQIAVPGLGVMARAWGLGWGLLRDGDPSERVHGHFGNTSVLVAVQAHADVSHAVLTNFATGASLAQHLVRDLFDVPLPPGAEPAAGASPSFAGFAGRYGSGLFSVEIRLEAGHLSMTNPLSGGFVPLAHLAGSTFLFDTGAIVTDVTFLPATKAEPAAMHMALRLLPRMPESNRS